MPEPLPSEEKEKSPNSGNQLRDEAVPAKDAATGSESGLPRKLTKEEQMALYEENLKESDWGHQPC